MPGAQNLPTYAVGALLIVLLPGPSSLFTPIAARLGGWVRLPAPPPGCSWARGATVTRGRWRTCRPPPEAFRKPYGRGGSGVPRFRGEAGHGRQLSITPGRGVNLSPAATRNATARPTARADRSDRRPGASVLRPAG